MKKLWKTDSLTGNGYVDLFCSLAFLFFSWCMFHNAEGLFREWRLDESLSYNWWLGALFLLIAFVFVMLAIIITTAVVIGWKDYEEHD